MEKRSRRILITAGGMDEYGVIEATQKGLRDAGMDSFLSLDPQDTEKCDGLLMPGGLPDVDPQLYGEENTGCGLIDRALDDRQLAMLESAVKAGKPVMGICRGMQLINVFFGGTLIQDLVKGENHRYVPEEDKIHTVLNLPQTPFHMLYGDFGVVNSMHHQAVRRVAEGFQVGQVWLSKGLGKEEKDEWIRKITEEETPECSVTCIIEAIFHRTLPIFATQWHPEFQASDPIPGGLEANKVFEFFAFMIERCVR